MEKLSFIIPILNEEQLFIKQQPFLKSLVDDGHEIIVVDGGSSDRSFEIAEDIGCICISTKASRGHQQHVGAKKSNNKILVFIHADTLLPSSAVKIMQTTLAKNDNHWGRFDVKLSNNKLIFKIIAWFMNKRSCLTGIVTGDHVLFMSKEVYLRCGGFPDIPIMEDIELSKKLRKYSWPICLNEHVTTSSRKWEQQGVLKTILLMWRLRILFYFGTPAEKIKEYYY